MKLVDLESQQPVFVGKPPENPYQLTKRNWTTACTIIPNSGCKLVMAGTADHEVRLYDIRSQRRPVSKLDWRESRVTAMVAEANGRAGTLSIDNQHHNMLHFERINLQSLRIISDIGPEGCGF